jgi:antirestriction protein ArdC
MPRNVATDRRYSGINILILWCAGFQLGFARQDWLTFRQASRLGGNVRKGERGTVVVYANRFETDAERRGAERDRREPDTVFMVRRFTVFNIDQCESLPSELATEPVQIPDALILPQVKALIEATNADIRIGGNCAYYNPIDDFIQVPRPEIYFESINWHRTVLHELAHWTGHPLRLARNLSGNVGSTLYAKEELVAEMTAAFVCASLGIIPTVRHADYIGSWLETLREDDRAIIRAASAASKAADYLLTFWPASNRPIETTR